MKKQTTTEDTEKVSKIDQSKDYVFVCDDKFKNKQKDKKTFFALLLVVNMKIMMFTKYRNVISKYNYFLELTAISTSYLNNLQK